MDKVKILISINNAIKILETKEKEIFLHEREYGALQAFKNLKTAIENGDFDE